jgi:hypothetical protein
MVETGNVGADRRLAARCVEKKRAVDRWVLRRYSGLARLAE